MLQTFVVQKHLSKNNNLDINARSTTIDKGKKEDLFGLIFEDKGM